MSQTPYEAFDACAAEYDARYETEPGDDMYETGGYVVH